MGLQGGEKYSCGSGGSIKIKCKKFQNDINSGAKIKCVGGVNPKNDNKQQINNYYHGNGGDGRIAIYYDENLNRMNKFGIIKPQPYTANTSNWRKSTLPPWQRLKK